MTARVEQGRELTASDTACAARAVGDVFLPYYVVLAHDQRRGFHGVGRGTVHHFNPFAPAVFVQRLLLLRADRELEAASP